MPLKKKKFLLKNLTSLHCWIKLDNSTWGRKVILKGKKTLDVKKSEREEAGKNGESSQGLVRRTLFHSQEDSTGV